MATVDVPGYTNRELFAIKGSGTGTDVENVDNVVNVNTVDSDEIFARFDAGLANINMNNELYPLMTDIRAVVNVYNEGPDILTDDKAPVELLGMKEIDRMISEELSYYRRVYAEEGVEGVLHMFT